MIEMKAKTIAILSVLLMLTSGIISITGSDADTGTTKGDFLIDGTHTVEVGGADKSFEQIKDLPDSYLAIDDVEMGHLNRIPLWMFGMLY